jgi:hypothetical protein
MKAGNTAAATTITTAAATSSGSGSEVVDLTTAAHTANASSTTSMDKLKPSATDTPAADSKKLTAVAATAVTQPVSVSDSTAVRAAVSAAAELQHLVLFRDCVQQALQSNESADSLIGTIAFLIAVSLAAAPVPVAHTAATATATVVNKQLSVSEAQQLLQLRQMHKFIQHTLASGSDAVSQLAKIAFVMPHSSV